MIATIVRVTIAFLVCGNDFGDSGTSIGGDYNEECSVNGDIDDNDKVTEVTIVLIVSTAKIVIE